MLLLLTGGTTADRWGLRRTVLCSDAALCVLLVVLLLTLHSAGSSLPLLALLAGTLGVVSAFRMPAAGAFPRLRADGPQLARAMALSGTVLTTARLTGTALGGVAVALSGTVLTTARLTGTALGGVAVALLALQGVLLVAVVGYLAVLLLVWSVPVPEAPRPRRRVGRSEPWPSRAGRRACCRCSFRLACSPGACCPCSACCSHSPPASATGRPVRPD